MKGISMKEFAQGIDKIFGEMKKDEIAAFIKHHTRFYTAEKRSWFLEELSNFSPDFPMKELDASIFEQLEELRDEIIEYRNSIEGVIYYDEYNQEVIPEAVLDAHVFTLQYFFHHSDELFLSGNLEAARMLYSRLFCFLSEDEYLAERADRILEDRRETAARYVRSVYESAPLKIRHRVLLDAMLTVSGNAYDEHEPSLRDIISSREEEFPDYREFMKSWCYLLAGGHTEREQVLLLEAMYMTRGIEGVIHLARHWKEKQPRGYLYWIDILMQQEAWEQAAAASREALSALPAGTALRHIAASRMGEAASRLGNRKLFLEASLQEFISNPQAEQLAALLAEADRQDARQQVLDQCLEALTPEYNDDLSWILLVLQGSAETVFSPSAQLPEGVFFPLSAVVLASSRLDKAVTVRMLARRLLTDSKQPGSAFIADEIIHALSDANISRETRETIFSRITLWGSRRITSIVTEKYTQRYREAAELLACLAECTAVQEGPFSAETFIKKYRNQLFARHSKFRKHLSQIMAASPLISTM